MIKIHWQGLISSATIATFSIPRKIENLSPKILKGYKNFSCNWVSSRSPIRAPGEQMSWGNGCFSGHNCGNGSSNAANENTPVKKPSKDDKCKKGCCGKDIPDTVKKLRGNASLKVSGCSAQGCCSSVFEISTAGPENNCTRKSSCGKHSEKPVACEIDFDDCHRKRFLTRKSGFQPARGDPDITKWPKHDGGNSKDTDCYVETEFPSESVSVGSAQVIDGTPRPGPRGGTDNIDMEQALFGVEHVVLRVQGVSMFSGVQ